LQIHDHGSQHESSVARFSTSDGIARHHMKRLLILVFASFILLGCQSDQGGSSIGHALGAIEIGDIKQANYLQDELPRYLGLPENKIRVEPGSGVSHVEIDGVPDTVGREALIAKLHDLEVSDPKLNPIKLRIYPGDDSIFKKATLIQR
jgi:hypothetical protein